MLFQIVENTPADVLEKWAILVTTGMSGPMESSLDPIGFITDYLLASDFKGRKVSGETDHRVLFEEFALHSVLAGAFLEGLDFLNELADIFELPVDRNVTDVGNRIDAVQLVHYFGSDVGRRDFVQVVPVEFAKDIVDRTTDDIHRDLSFFARLHETAKKLFAIDCLTGPVAFDHAEFGSFDLFISGEAGSAIEALPSTADRGAVLGGTGIDHLVLVATTLNTAHRENP